MDADDREFIGAAGWHGCVAQAFGFDGDSMLQLVGHAADAPGADGASTTTTLKRGDLLLVGHVRYGGTIPNLGTHWALALGDSKVFSLLRGRGNNKLERVDVNDMMAALHAQLRREGIGGDLRSYVVRNPWAQMKERSTQIAATRGASGRERGNRPVKKRKRK